MPIEKSSPTVFTPLDDGTGVLLNLETLLYYSLNRTGAALWQVIEDRKSCTLDELIRATCQRFDVEAAVARREVHAFIGRLQNLKMVRVQQVQPC